MVFLQVDRAQEQATRKVRNTDVSEAWRNVGTDKASSITRFCHTNQLSHGADLFTWFHVFALNLQLPHFG